MKKYNVFVSGVGGQGIVTLGQLLKIAALEANLHIIGTETRGATMREGSVTATVRYGIPEDGDEAEASERKAIYAGLILTGSADLLIALEPLEGLRVLNFAGPNTVICVNEYTMPGRDHLSGALHYPTKEEYIEKMKNFTPNVFTINANEVARDLFGSFTLMNLIFLGFVIGCAPNFPISIDVMKKTIEKEWPRAFADNEKALMTGYEEGQKAIA